MLAALRTAFDRAVQWTAFGLIGGLLVVVMLGVITRAAGDPLIWTDEISRFLMVWVAVFGWLLASRRRAHIRIRFFHDLLPKPAGRGWEIVIQLALIVFGALLAWFGVDIVIRNHDMQALTLPISLAWMYVPIVLAGLVTVAQGAAELLERLQRAKAPAAGDEGLVE
jgi:TRAP-type C4-dicarboxylate transport system permease small subunit